MVYLILETKFTLGVCGCVFFVDYQCSFKRYTCMHVPFVVVFSKNVSIIVVEIAQLVL